MLGNIKNRFWSLQEEISSSVRQFTPAQIVEEATECDDINPYAGGGLLEAWQIKWEELHRAHEKNARKAAKCDKTITRINNAVDNQWKHIMTLQALVSQIPHLTDEIDKSIKVLGAMESLFSDVEISLLALEDTIDARELQEKQSKRNFQLTMHQEKTKAKFNELSSQLENQYQTKKREIETKKTRANQERQKHYAEQFERDMNAYRNAGTTNRLAPPKSFDPDASLETVDLNEDDTGLEKFLSDDLLYDVSPLPKDDEDKLPRLTSLKKEGSRETLQNEIQSLEESALYDTSRNPIIHTEEISSDEEICGETQLNPELANSNSNQGNLQAENSIVSRSESLYYTPDDTLEKLSDLSINESIKH